MMNTRRIAIAIMSAIILTMSYGVNGQDARNTLVGVFEYEGTAEVDCVTRVPKGPVVKVSYMFHQGGTNQIEDTFPLSGPWRSTGVGTWKRLTGRDYSYGNIHYEFNEDRTYSFTIKQQSILTLSVDGNSFTENGTFQGIDGAGTVLFSGCFAGTSQRLNL